MDYSSSLHDGDNPAEASPWGSSPAPSPKHNRSGFNPTPEAPSSPVYGQNREHGDSYTSDSGIAGEPGQPDESVNAHAYSEGQDTTEPHVEHPGQQSGEQQPPGHSEQQRQAHPGQDAQRQQGASRPAVRQGPHYKLQAKITGLERVGRKDPILRFDVHVRVPVPFVWFLFQAPCANQSRLISRLSEQHSSVMCGALIRNLLNSRTI